MKVTNSPLEEAKARIAAVQEWVSLKRKTADLNDEDRLYISRELDYAWMLVQDSRQSYPAAPRSTVAVAGDDGGNIENPYSMAGVPLMFGFLVFVFWLGEHTSGARYTFLFLSAAAAITIIYYSLLRLGSRRLKA